MDEHVFQHAAIDAYEELTELNQEREELQERLVELERDISLRRLKIVSLLNLLEEEPKPGTDLANLVAETVGMGLTDAVREVLKANQIGMTPLQIRDGLLKIGYDLSKYNNVQASIHAILKRLHRNYEVARSIDDKGKPLGKYAWNPLREIEFKPPSAPVLVKMIERRKKPIIKVKKDKA